MKDSGVEWVGEFPKHWSCCKFKNIASIYNGNSIKDEEKGNYDDSEAAVPYIATKDIEATYKKINYNNGMYVKNSDTSFKRAPQSSTLLCIEGGSAGKKVAFTNQEVCFINKLCCFHSNSINNKFIYYFIQSAAFSEEFKLNISGLIGGVSISSLKDFPILIPTNMEQSRIVDYLDEKCAEIDDIIAAKEKTNELLKERRQSIIYEAVTKGLDPNVSMKDSGIEWIGVIPFDWECSKAKHYIQISNGSEPKTEGDVPVYGSGSGYFKTCGESKNGPTVLLGRKGTVDIPRYVEGLYWNVDTAFDVKVQGERMLLKYYFYLATCFDYPFYTATTTLPSMTQTSYENMYIPVPNINMQEKLVQYVESKCEEIDSLISTNDSTIEKLKEYRQSIIYEAVTGKIEV